MEKAGASASPFPYCVLLTETVTGCSWTVTVDVADVNLASDQPFHVRLHRLHVPTSPPADLTYGIPGHLRHSGNPSIPGPDNHDIDPPPVFTPRVQAPDLQILYSPVI
jgi:hypothetical protein